MWPHYSSILAGNKCGESKRQRSCSEAAAKIHPSHPVFAIILLPFVYLAHRDVSFNSITYVSVARNPHIALEASKPQAWSTFGRR
jgi:hypothetical protein